MSEETGFKTIHSRTSPCPCGNGEVSFVVKVFWGAFLHDETTPCGSCGNREMPEGGSEPGIVPEAGSADSDYFNETLNMIFAGWEEIHFNNLEAACLGYAERVVSDAAPADEFEIRLVGLRFVFSDCDDVPDGVAVVVLNGSGEIVKSVTVVREKSDDARTLGSKLFYGLKGESVSQ